MNLLSESYKDFKVVSFKSCEFLLEIDHVKFIRILFLVRGKMVFDLGGKKLIIRKGECIILNKVEIYEIKPKTKIFGYLSIFSDEFLYEQIIEKSSNIFSDLFIKHQFVLIAINQGDLYSFIDIWKLLIRATEKRDKNFYGEIIHHIFYLIYYYLAEAYLGKKRISGLMISQNKAKIVIDFYRELEGNFVKNREIKFYAEKLCVSSVLLSRYIKEITGKTVRQVINENIFWEAKKLLGKSSMSISEIAIELNFSGISSFSVFFKRHCGLSPSEFRRKIK